MNRLSKLGLSAVAILAIAAGCGGDDNTNEPSDDDGGGASGGGGGVTATPESISIVSDTNRDGLVDDFDNAFEELWTVEAGSVFLPNYDDDNADQIRDRDTITLDGDGDVWDCAPIFVQPYADAPDTALGVMNIDPWSMPHIKIHKLGVNGWEIVGGSHGACGANGDPACEFSNPTIYLTVDEVRNGVQMCIEGKTLAGLFGATSPDPNTGGALVPWSGVVEMNYAVYETPESPAPIITDDQPTGVDVMQMRVAAWMMFGNTTPQFDTVLFDDSMPAFVQGNDAVAAAEGHNNWAYSNYSDQWTEDWLQTGFVSVPMADGQVHGMMLTMPRPFSQGGSLPINWIADNLLGVDSGYMQVYRNANSGSTRDSHGNHDLIPAHTGTDGHPYPYGRIIHGAGILPETKVFYDSQIAQGPSLEVDTMWLIVQHVDEVFSYVPANTERGWKLMVGSPDLAVQMLQEWQGQGFGGQIMFQGKSWSNGQPAAISIDEALGDPQLMSASQTAQAEIDGMLNVFVAATGLQPDEIVEIPFLFEQDFGALVAYNPGTVNSYVADGFINIPDPWGPMINGVDGFKQDLQDRLGTPVNNLGFDGQGLRVYFTDDWELYHRLLGEVHCGTNYLGPAQPEIQWWGAML